MLEFSIRLPVSERQEQEFRYARFRHLLLTERFELHRAAPLSNWVNPTDRQLPRSLLPLTLDEILRQPYRKLAETPGIGLIKLQKLLQLLDRAVHCGDHPEPLFRVVDHAGVSVDPANISEVTWMAWRKKIAEADLGDEKLGRFADSLQELPRAIWESKLSSYLSLSLSELRRLRTHGRKRVRNILGICGRLYEALREGRESASELPVCITAVDRWLKRTLDAGARPDRAAMLTHFVEPLLEQIRVDVGDTAALIIKKRSGFFGKPVSIRRVAAEAYLTRTRVYQLLESSSRAMRVRWPIGLQLLQSLALRYSSQENPVESSLIGSATNILVTNPQGAIREGAWGENRQDSGERIATFRSCVSVSPEQSSSNMLVLS